MKKTESITEESGIKYDEGKLAYELLPVDALAEVVRVYTYGKNKYSARNWENGMDFSRMYGALQRHSNAFWNGEDLDQESKCYHMASVAFCALALIEYSIHNKDFDDRPIKK